MNKVKNKLDKVKKYLIIGLVIVQVSTIIALIILGFMSPIDFIFIGLLIVVPIDVCLSIILFIAIKILLNIINRDKELEEYDNVLVEPHPSESN
ncbi:MAG: hypothetical protein ACTSO7_11065 [Candidatus Heimdallarchaeota archaeon]